MRYGRRTIVMHPELVSAGLPRQRVPLEDNLSLLDDRLDALLGTGAAVEDLLALAIVLVVVERGPLADGRDAGDELRLASPEAVDADPVLSTGGNQVRQRG